MVVLLLINLLPEEDKFYNLSVELPDYDMYSSNAMKDAKDLADIYHKLGYDEVLAKSGMHHGTYKVNVNFIPIADISQLDEKLFKSISKQSMSINGIRYAPVNYLRMSMYLELSRPKGDISRWEKVLKRLVLFNKNYPLKGRDCKLTDIQRVFDESTKITKDEMHKIFYITRDSFINQGVIFFGALANSLYMKKLPRKERIRLKQIPDFDVLSEDPETTAVILKERLQDEGITYIKIVKRDGLDEIIAPHYEVRIKDETIAFIYKPIECHSYNIIKRDGKVMKIATIDTMLNLFLAFLYANRPYYDINRIFCMSEYLFKVQQKNRLAQKGLLKRFSIKCYGQAVTIESILKERTAKYKELKHKRGSKEFNSWFLRYVPGEKKSKKTRKTKMNKAKKNTKSKKNEKNQFKKQSFKYNRILKY